MPPNDCVDRADDVKAVFFDGDGQPVTHDGSSAILAPPVADEHAIAGHGDDQFPARRLTVGTFLHYQEVAGLDTEFLEIPLRSAKNDFVLFNEVLRNQEGLSGNAGVNWQTLRDRSGETKDVRRFRSRVRRTAVSARPIRNCRFFPMRERCCTAFYPFLRVAFRNPLRPTRLLIS